MTTPKTPKTSKTPRILQPRTRKRSAPKKISGDLMAGVAAALDKKAENLVVLDLTKASAFTDFFVICTGTNRRQVQAIADAVQEALAKRGLEAGPDRGLRARRVDPHRLLRLHRARLHAGDPRVLRPREALGRRGADRHVVLRSKGPRVQGSEGSTDRVPAPRTFRTLGPWDPGTFSDPGTLPGPMLHCTRVVLTRHAHVRHQFRHSPSARTVVCVVRRGARAAARQSHLRSVLAGHHGRGAAMVRAVRRRTAGLAVWRR